MINEIYFNSHSILFVGSDECKPCHSYGPGFRDHNVLHFITSGKGVFHINGKTYELSSGNGFYFPKNKVVEYCADKDAPWSYTWIAFTDEYTEKCLENIGITESSPVFYKNDPEIFRYAEIISSSLKNSDSEYTLLSHTYALLSVITANAAHGSVQEKYVKRAIEFMKFNLYNNITVEDAANYAGIEKSYLNRLFKEQLGITPVSYLIKLKMEEAQRELGNPEFRLRDIAYNVGYADQFVFSKAFKRYWGLSPSEYRERAFGK